MRMTFSQRMGYKPVKSVIQVDSMDDDLRNGLWNNFQAMQVPHDDEYLVLLWTNFFNKPIDKQTRVLVEDFIQEAYFKLKWHEVYDFIEFFASILQLDTFSERFIHACNSTLERELSAYRFVGKRIVQITSNQEIAEIEEALSVSLQFTHHLDRALELLANKKRPDYANSIKESISAVEALCRLITGDPTATLGKALESLEKSYKVELHHNLKDAFKNLYWYTSDAEGIRHGLVGKSDLGVEDAKFMMIACSAFINYLVAKADKAGRKLSPGKSVTKKGIKSSTSHN